jgi:hypothetical protein
MENQIKKAKNKNSASLLLPIIVILAGTIIASVGYGIYTFFVPQVLVGNNGLLAMLFSFVVFQLPFAPIYLTTFINFVYCKFNKIVNAIGITAYIMTWTIMIPMLGWSPVILVYGAGLFASVVLGLYFWSMFTFSPKKVEHENQNN